MKQPNYQENWDKKEQFMREVAPIIDQLHKKCLELHIPMICAAQYAEKDEMSQIQSAAAINGETMNVNKRLIMIAQMLHDNEFFDQIERALFMMHMGGNPFGGARRQAGPEELFRGLFGADFLAGGEDEEDEDD